MIFATIICGNGSRFYYFFMYFEKSACNGVCVLIESHCKDKTTQNKEVKKMEYETTWNEEELEELEELNEIFNL